MQFELRGIKLTSHGLLGLQGHFRPDIVLEPTHLNLSLRFHNMFFAAVLLQTILATAAFAAPSGRLAKRLERRREGSHLSKPVQFVDGHIPATSNTSHVEYSSNWAGAVWDSYPSVSSSSFQFQARSD